MADKKAAPAKGSPAKSDTKASEPKKSDLEKRVERLEKLARANGWSGV